MQQPELSRPRQEEMNPVAFEGFILCGRLRNIPVSHAIDDEKLQISRNTA